MRKCRKCGRELNDDELVCPNCTRGEKLTGIAPLKDGDETDLAYREACSKRYANASDEPSSSTRGSWASSSSWLRRVSGRYEGVTWLIYLMSVPTVIGYLEIFGYNGWVSVLVCLAIVWFFVCAGMVYSAIGAHLKGMADIVDMLNEIRNK